MFLLSLSLFCYGLAEFHWGIQGSWWFANQRLSGQIEKLRLSGNPTLHFGWLHMLAGWCAGWMSSYSPCILRQLLVNKVSVKDKQGKNVLLVNRTQLCSVFHDTDLIM